jgi:hypothetical protein
MSANTINTVAIATTVSNELSVTPIVSEVRVKKATLSAKYSKFLIFGYSLVCSLESKGLISAESLESAFTELKLMGTVEEQSSLYESLLSQSNSEGKLMRKYITNRNKPPKAPKAVRAKKVPSESSSSAEKKPRAKKTSRVANDSNTDLVNQIVAAANSDITESVVEPVLNIASTTTEIPVVSASSSEVNAAKELKETKAAEAKVAKELKETKAAEAKVAKELKETKAAEVKAAKELKESEKLAAKELKETKAAEVKAAKELKESDKLAAKVLKESKSAEVKATKSKKDSNKTKTDTVPAIIVAPSTPLLVEELIEDVIEVEEEEEDISTQEMELNGKSYLIDSYQNIYSVDTHEPLGIFDADSQQIIAQEN